MTEQQQAVGTIQIPIFQVVAVHRTEGELKDSITIGTPGKGGEVKVYFDANDIKGSMERIDNMRSLLDYAREKFTNGGA